MPPAHIAQHASVPRAAAVPSSCAAGLFAAGSPGRDSPCWRGMRSAWLSGHEFLRAAPGRAGHRRATGGREGHGQAGEDVAARREQQDMALHGGGMREQSARSSSVVDGQRARPDSAAPEASPSSRRSTEDHQAQGHSATRYTTDQPISQGHAARRCDRRRLRALQYRAHQVLHAVTARPCAATYPPHAPPRGCGLCARFIHGVMLHGIITRGAAVSSLRLFASCMSLLADSVC